MLEHINLDKVLFLDIETVSQKSSYDELNSEEQALWIRKAQFIRRTETESIMDSYLRAGIYAEFGKVVCISVGYFTYLEKRPIFIVRSFYGDDEKNLLHQFIVFVKESFNRANHLLCAHNGKEFDFPYLCRRMLVNRLPLPEILNIAGKKPWEIHHLDTMELWRFGDYKSYTPLNLLTNIFNIPTSKDDIDGGMVGQIYWQDSDLRRIVEYCQKDVISVARVFLAMKGYETFPDVDISVQ